MTMRDYLEVLLWNHLYLIRANFHGILIIYRFVGVLFCGFASV